MRFAALAADYDGTLASDGRVAPETLHALERLKQSGRKLLLVTGRELDELIGVFPGIRIFDRVVAENGALQYCPRTGARKPLGMPPPPEFVSELRCRGVDPLSVGNSICATVTPNEKIVLETIRDLGLELQVIFNKGAVMVLPAGINKASGLAAALDDLGLSPRNVAAIGDAENDHALLRLAEFGVAVANALPMLKRIADHASTFDHGAAVIELIDAILADDLRAWSARAARRSVLLGYHPDRRPFCVPPAGANLLIAGPSGSGKSVYATGILERLAGDGYQYCVVDPEGDYGDLPGAVVLGSDEREPALEEVSTALENPHTNLVINLSGLAAPLRPGAFKEIAASLTALRAICGRPHWILLGEAHCLLPADDPDPSLEPDPSAPAMLYVTVHPEAMARSALASVEAVVAIGARPDDTLARFAQASGASPAPAVVPAPQAGEAVAWLPHRGEPPFRFLLQPSEAQRKQHRRRLVEGQLPVERSFFFRGAQKKLNLRAQNLPLFLQIGMGVDDETWLYHLRAGDYSRWLCESVKEPRLANEVAQVEKSGADAQTSRERISAILQRYMGAEDAEPAARA